MSALPALLSPCVDEAIAHAALLVEHAVDVAGEALELEQRGLSRAEDRQDYSAALRELAKQRPGWRVRYPQLLRAAVEQPARPSAPRMRPSSLTLVDDQEVMQSIEASRLTQELAALVEQPLAELDRLVSSALGLDGVHPGSNPLRPEVFAQALRAVLAETAARPHWPGLWMRHMAVPLADDLFELYGAAIRLLRHAHVEAAAYRVVTGPAPLGGSSRPAPLAAASNRAPLDAAPRRAGGPSGFIDLITQALRGPLFTDFLFKGSAQAAQRLEPGYYARLDEELAAIEGRADEAPPDPALLRAEQHVPPVDRTMREVGTATPLSREVWGAYAVPRQRALVRAHLKKKAENVGQVMGVEVVRQLLDQVARDPRLLAPVREAIVALEPALARLALHSPRFFADDRHPGRRLVARVAERSFKYNDEFAPEFQRFFAPVSGEFKALNGQGTLGDEQPFGDALQRLEAHWSAQDAQEEQLRERLRQAAQLAERRQAEAGEICWGLSQRSDLEGVPEVVQDFLYRRWAMVMAHARVQAGVQEIDPGGYGATVTDLLWTVKRETALRDPARAFELIPRVVTKLRAGLQMVGDAPAEGDRFFRALERLHRPVLKLRARHRRQAFDAPSEFPATVFSDAGSDPHPAHAEELWLAPDELHAFGFEEAGADFPEHDVPVARSAPAQPAAPTAQLRSLPGASLAAPQVEAIINALAVDDWVDLFSKKEWHRARLTWASGNAALFMFVSHGGRPHSMTRRTLHRLVGTRLLRPVAAHEVVQHAIETLSRPEPQPMAA